MKQPKGTYRFFGPPSPDSARTPMRPTSTPAQTQVAEDERKSRFAKSRWKPIQLGSVAARNITWNWWCSLHREGARKTVRTLLNEGEYETPVQRTEAPNTTFRTKISASHTATTYVCSVSIHENGHDWGSACSCPSGYASVACHPMFKS